ncbi:regulatory signaling modulator protein AmpE [Pseudomonas sp. UL073]|uniref:Regulatory signaling modulator protein AmpE n=1 Tax=Zestomonas insulae TaxID=2809017 RepID=A0ABS2IEK3_9GAMM|nr:regulatory signaling modulator protein AmpE [Pseudomonas insulae]MBM7061521.1 regulatory signaling modulator protein AmpE [Pseudomonas insulae]
MSFLVLLLVLWVEKFSSWRRHIQHDGPWLRLLARVEHSGTGAWAALVVLVLLPVALLGLLLVVLQPLAHGWLALPVHLLVLIYSLGRTDVLAALGPFRDAWRRGDSQAGYHVAERDLQLAEVDEERTLLQRVQAYLLWQGYQSFFAVIFWYALLGPLAALAYRLLALSGEQAQQPALREQALQLRHALDWLPVRVLAASFALVGNFMAVTRVVLHELLNWDIPAAQLVDKAGHAADDLAEPAPGEAGVASLDTLWQLLLRAAVLWYAAFALWALFF